MMLLRGRRSIHIGVVVLVLAVAEWSLISMNVQASQRDLYGGWSDRPTSFAPSVSGNDYFRLEKITATVNGQQMPRWFLVTPTTHNPFISFGIDWIKGWDWNHNASTSLIEVYFSPDFPYAPLARGTRAYYGDQSSRWEEHTAQRMRQWGFNTLGAVVFYPLRDGRT